MPTGLSDVARELLLIAFAAATYAGVRAATEGSVAAATENGERLLRLERALGLAWEETLQSVLLTTDLLVTLGNWVYIWGHWPVIVTVAVVLYVYRHSSYTLLRNAMFISGAIGFLFFVLWPVAPPRLLDVGLVDTVLERSRSYRALQPPSLTNQYAAFPSLHFGWNLLVGIVLFQSFRHRGIRVFAVAMPIAMALAVVATANHFVIDVLAGTVVVLLGLLSAKALVAARDVTRPEPRGPASVPRRSRARDRGTSRP